MNALVTTLTVLLLGFVAVFIAFAISVRMIYESYIKEEDHEPLESSYEYR